MKRDHDTVQISVEELLPEDPLYLSFLIFDSIWYDLALQMKPHTIYKISLSCETSKR
jgi:hypothetical protein